MQGPGLVLPSVTLGRSELHAVKCKTQIPNCLLFQMNVQGYINLKTEQCFNFLRKYSIKRKIFVCARLIKQWVFV